MSKLRRLAPSLGLIPVIFYIFGRSFPRFVWRAAAPLFLAFAGIVLIISGIRQRNTVTGNSFLRSSLGVLLFAFGFVLFASWRPEMGSPISV